MSTIRSSDKIFFLSNGQVAEEGSHDYLMSLEAGYFSLVKTQEAVASLSGGFSEANRTGGQQQQQLTSLQGKNDRYGSQQRSSH